MPPKRKATECADHAPKRRRAAIANPERPIPGEARVNIINQVFNAGDNDFSTVTQYPRRRPLPLHLHLIDKLANPEVRRILSRRWLWVSLEVMIILVSIDTQQHVV